MSYDRFKEHLSEMHRKAISILKLLNEEEQYRLKNFLNKCYPSQEHYWAVKKLFCHAMYIPMFLIIGRKHFKKLVYIDTHAGPGLAKIGRGDNEIILGSPLISIFWPSVIAQKVRRFSGIIDGFDELYLIEKDQSIEKLLHNIINAAVGHNVDKIIPCLGDCNTKLPKIISELSAESNGNGNDRILVYLFADPYGKLESQLKYNVLKSLTEELTVDVMMTVMSVNIARGLSKLKGLDRERSMEIIFGENVIETLNLKDGARTISPNHVIQAYKRMMGSIGYKKVKFIPVEFAKGTIYHVMLATKGKGKWIDNYVDYIRNKSPQDYDTLKALFLQAIGKQSSIEQY